MYDSCNFCLFRTFMYEILRKCGDCVRYTERVSYNIMLFYSILLAKDMFLYLAKCTMNKTEYL